MPTDPRVDAHIEAAADFARPLLLWMRARVHAAVPEVEESIKWARPAFLLGGRPFAMMIAFKAHCSFGFWEHAAASWNKDSEVDAVEQFRRVTSFSDLPDAATFEAMARAAADRLAAGGGPRRPPRTPRRELPVPPELAAALATDDAARATFDAFPPSSRREYSEWIGEAKRPETRARRTEEAITWLREGKRRNWKYE
ncbi:YdeI/OmpD-associated family protein [uncultured Sphingomonas sp.]|uniref:YdeI/OmpD-associated family protein n=1 Tax=uncultured Sphingomonas sp. TaxID=158754 RepID=UPI0025E7AB92|nr:YdeI/OmpD-associated family protein [uncultured Sphingomonas sp.]